MENSWVFGIRRPHDLVALAPGLRLVESRKGSAGPIVTLAINPA
jgi:hypothetical protein